MIGIYKITNKINGMVYIGQSVRIERRFTEHNIPSNNSTLIDKAINEYGKENFTYEVIEECEIKDLIDREQYWINYYNCITPNGYNRVINNQTLNTIYRISKETVDNIKNDLINTTLSASQIAEKNNVGISTVSRINHGIIYIDENRQYPLRQFQSKKINTCIDCGKIISYYAKRCPDCAKKNQSNTSQIIISREELKNLIRNKTFLEIGKMFQVSDNAIKKRCKKFNLPYRKKDIKNYTDEEWSEV